MANVTDTSSDVERDAAVESYLTNDSVHSLGWHKVQVNTTSRASDSKPKSILSDIDGYAKAGMIISHRPRKTILTPSRATDCADGSIRLRKNYTPQYFGP